MLINNVETWLGVNRVVNPALTADDMIRAAWDNAYELGREHGLEEGKDIAMEEAEDKYYDYDELKEFRDNCVADGADPDELIEFWENYHDKQEELDSLLCDVKSILRAYEGPKLAERLIEWATKAKEALDD